VEEASLSPAPAKAARRSVDELRDALSPEAYWRQKTWKRIAVIFAGPGVNIALAVVLIALGYIFGVPGDADRTVRNVKPNTPAAAVGLRPGDRIIAVNGRQTPDFNTVSQLIRASKGKPTTVTVSRNGKPVTLGPVRTRKIGDRWGLRGRAVGREVYERVSAIGIALFLVLMFIGLSNDINRLGGG